MTNLTLKIAHIAPSDYKLVESSATPRDTAQTINTPQIADGLSAVVVEAIPTRYIRPEGVLEITQNGVYNVKRYKYVSIDTGTLTLKGYIERGVSDIDDDCITIIKPTLSDGTNHDYYPLFQYDLNLRSVTLRALTQIGQGAYAFEGCDNLVSLYLPSCTTIGGRGLCDCGVQTITLPAVQSIGERAFEDDEKLRLLDLSGVGTVPTLAHANALSGTPIASGSGEIRVKKVMLSDFKAATNWSTYASRIKGV